MNRTDIDRSAIPSQPGVYLFKTKGTAILYIGKAKDLKKRLQQYFSPSSLWKQDMVAKAHSIERLPVASENDAILLETQLINTHKPTYNNLIKGDTSYVYIKIRKHPFPNIEITRYKKPDGSLYIGPKIRRRDLKYSLQVLRQTFKYRSCGTSKFNKAVACSDYFFGLCAGRCVYNRMTDDVLEHNQRIGFAPEREAEQAYHQYQDMLKLFTDFFKGRHKPLQQALLTEVDRAVEHERYERAAKLRDCYHSIERLTQGQEVVLEQSRTGTYAMIKTHKDLHYYVVLSIVEGKIIDVITNKEYTQDVDKDSLLSTIQREYTSKQETMEQSTQDDYDVLYVFDTKRLGRKHLQQLQQHATSFLTGYINASLAQMQGESEDILARIQERYNLSTYPVRIEAVDISHMSGKHTVGAISCLERGYLAKQSYRRYKINEAQSSDDYGALREVLMRRFQLHQSHKTPEVSPDLLIIDGGKGQLSVVRELREEYPEFKQQYPDMAIMGIGKGKARQRKGKVAGQVEEAYLLHQDGTITHQQLALDNVDRLLRKARDEAHRFANAYRKILLRKSHIGD